MRWENKGYSEDEIRKRIKKLRRDMMTKFVLNDLTMLERSGRLNGLQAKLADAFHICPILASTDEGTICQTGQARGMKVRCLRWCVQLEMKIKKKRFRIL